MERLEIQQKEFNLLQTAFLDQVIVGKNIFYKTSPEEVDKYKNFIKKLAPFDVVIDGLNVIFKGLPNREKVICFLIFSLIYTFFKRNTF